MNLKRKKFRYAKSSEWVQGTTVKGFLNYCQERISWLFNGKNKQVTDEKGKTKKVNLFLTEEFDCDETFNK